MRGMGETALWGTPGDAGFKMEFILTSKIIDFLPNCIPYMV